MVSHNIDNMIDNAASEANTLFPAPLIWRVVRFQVVLAVTLIALAAGMWMAATEAQAQARPQVVGPAGMRLSMELNKGRLVRLARPASTVFVADPRVADVQVKSPSLVYVFAKATGETTLFAVDEAERVLANVDISVDHNLSRLERAIQRLHPEEQIQVSSIDGALILDGSVGSAAAAEGIRRLATSFAGSPEAVINRVGIDAPNQINLRVRVAELSRDVDKAFGIDFEAIGTADVFSLALTSANPFAGAATSALSSAVGTNNFDFNGVIDALEQEGLISILAEPNLTALTGETASFLAGGEFPILVPNGDGTVTVEFREFGISLAFTPTLVNESRVNIKVRPEVSDISSADAVALGGFEVPSLTTRRAETTVELGSGQSFAIAGLLQNDVSQTLSKFPGLGDVPILGNLFRSDSFQRKETELVIIVTPYVVKPTSSRRLSTPADGFQPPNDIERIGGGANFRRAPAPGRPVVIDKLGNELIGPVGFLVE